MLGDLFTAMIEEGLLPTEPFVEEGTIIQF